MSDLNSDDYLDVTHADARVGTADRVLEPVRRVFRAVSVLLLAVMIGLPLVSQLLFAGFLTTRPRKRPYLLLGIHLRVAALAGAAVAWMNFLLDLGTQL